MRNIFNKKVFALVALVSISMFVLTSCEKDSDGSPGYKVGTPAAPNGIKPDSGSGGTVLTLQGTGLGQMRSVVFSKNNVPAPFQTTLNTETAMIFRVPDTAYGGPQDIIFTNSDGKTLTIPFRVLAYPVVSAAFPTDFEAGSTVTLTGSNLDDVTTVLINGTTDAATIVSKTRSQMVITMPASSVDKGFLKITNATGTIITTQEFVNVAKAIPVFNDDLRNNFQNWGWGGTYAPSTEAKISGTGSMKAAFDPSGSWGGMQLGGGTISLSATHKFFTFWVMGADVDKNVQFWINWGNQKVFTVPANKWTYFKYNLATEFPGVTNVDNVTFQMHNEGKTIYFDNIMFTK
jgi:IPT/TIG domain